MGETVTLEVPKAEAELIQARIEICLEQIRRALTELNRDQEEIERLKGKVAAPTKTRYFRFLSGLRFRCENPG